MNIQTLAVVTIILYAFYRAFRSYLRLSHVPGPLPAKFTNLQRVWWVKSGRAHKYHRQMHEQYGKVVRFGPNMVSISDPSGLSIIYPNRSGFLKSDFYRTQKPYSPKNGVLPAVFNTQDEVLHRKLRKPIAALYSMTSVVDSEPFVDETMEIFFQELDTRFGGTGRLLDLSKWLQFFAFDVMGMLSFSRRHGFLENGRDVCGILEGVWAFMKTVAPATQMPWFDRIWNKNPIIALFKQTTGLAVLEVANRLVAERQASSSQHELEKRDMLSKFLEIRSKDPNVPEWAPKAWTFSNILAGSDTTATAMTATLYHLLECPTSMETLVRELSHAQQRGRLSLPYPSWHEVRELPYLDACIKEALRLNPPFCLPFERIVPDGGITVCGTYLEAGTVVGMNPYIINRDRETYGDDADKWRPERWLETDENKRRRLENCILTFGFGRRTCLGRNLAIFEMKKLFPALIMRYEMTVVKPLQLKVENSWLVKQSDLHVQIRLNKTVLPPRLNIPSSSSTAVVRVIDPDTTLDLNPTLFWQPTVDEREILKVPTYCFLISSGKRHVLFDLGVRSDWENLAPAAAELIRKTTRVYNARNIADILDKSSVPGCNIRSKDIEAIIWSHDHFDHIGDPSTFPLSTNLVVGPGLRDAWPGYPSNPTSRVLDSDIEGRQLHEISFNQTNLKVGPFDAFDYFGNGSFYLLNAPGHSIGHMCGLARVTTAPDTFIFMGADACHHPGVLRPTRYRPLPPDYPSPSGFSRGDAFSLARDEAFFKVSPSLTVDHSKALETVEKIKDFDSSDDVFVILPHDHTLKGRISFFPESINNWRAREYKSSTKWVFCENLADL
ncbi:cytochrome P450 [Aspergillus spinulosporus]